MMFRLVAVLLILFTTLTTVWSQGRDRQTPARFSARDLSGTWTLRITDPYAWYDFRWEIREAGDGEWVAEQTLVDTNHSFHRGRLGQKLPPYTLVLKGNGELTGFSSGDDPNPGNKGAFSQRVTLKLSGGELVGTGQHRGSEVTHEFKVKGTRGIRDELAGSYLMKITDPYAEYDMRWDVRRTGDGEWTAEQTLVDTTHAFHASRKGQKFDIYRLVRRPNGEILATCTGGDPNPGNPGHFTQRATLKWENGVLSGEGEHKGASLTHWIKYNGKRSAAKAEPDDLSGSWSMTVTDPYARYEFRWDIRKDGDNGWIAEQTLLDTTHPAHAGRKGQKLDSFRLVRQPNGEILATCTGGDPNPGNPGHFTQKAILKLDKGVLSGEGEHKGSAITHWIKYNAKRGAKSGSQASDR